MKLNWAYYAPLANLLLVFLLVFVACEAFVATEMSLFQQLMVYNNYGDWPVLHLKQYHCTPTVLMAFSEGIVK